MNHLLDPISEEVFKEKVDIRFNNINDGLLRFQNSMIESNHKENLEEKLIMFMEKAFELNGENNSYVDFYFSKLNEEEKKSLVALLNDEDKEFLNRHINSIKYQSIYFRLSKEMIPFITRLCAREMLFSSFYYTKFPCTIWGNYNMKFPIFFKDKDIIEKYKKIIDACGIEMNKR